MKTTPLHIELEYIVRHCASMCEPECCGLNACDFSPFHLATFLLAGEEKKLSKKRYKSLGAAIDNLLVNYGTNGASASGANFKLIGPLTCKQVDEWVNVLRTSIRRAVELIESEYG